MIEQGRIDYILNADSEARRFLIEEAAGISKFKVKKEEAIRKLERTEDNRLRINDIVHEVQKNIQYAERQARRAERYREEFEKLKKWELSKAFRERVEIQEDRTAVEKDSDAYVSRIKNLDADLLESRRKQEEIRNSLHQVLERFRHEDAHRYELRSKIEKEEQQLKFNQEKRIERASRRGQIQAEEAQLKERLKKNTVEIASKKEELAGFANARQSANDLLQASESSLQHVDEELKRLEESSKEMKTQAFEAASRATQRRNEFHRVTSFLETNRDHRIKRESNQKRLVDDQLEGLSKRESYDQEIVSISEKVFALQKQTDELQGALQQQEKYIDGEKKFLEKESLKIMEMEARHGMLKEIQITLQEDDAKIVEMATHPDRNGTRRLCELFKVKPGFEWALDAALDNFMRSLVTENAESAEKLLECAIEQKASPIGIFIKNGHPYKKSNQLPEKPNHPDIVGHIQDVVEVKPGYEYIFEHFFECLYVVNTRDRSKLIRDLLPLAWENKFITRDGIVLGPKRKILYRNGGITHNSNAMQRESEISRLEVALKHLNNQAQSRRVSLENSENSLAAKRQEIKALESEHMDFTVQNKSSESLRYGIEDRLTAIQRELDLFRDESHEMKSEEDIAIHQKKAVEEELAKAEAEERRIQSDHEKLSHLLQQLGAKRSESLKLLVEHKTRFETLDERRRLIGQSVAFLIEQESQDKDRVTSLEEETKQLDEKELALSQEDQDIAANRGQMEVLCRESEVALEIIRREKDSSEEDVHAIDGKIEEISQSQSDYQRHVHQNEMKVKDLEYRCKAMSERLQQTYRVDISSYQASDYLIEDLSNEDLEKKIADLQKRVESLGTVNLLAIEEYEELKQRFDFLQTQQKDLDDARNSLLETIRKVNRTTKGLFEETFNRVQETFQDYFQTLFRGGHARLVLVDESNPLESGVDIVVRPPSKKLQHISLLSGGEKALTAIALLFALFKIKPSPFSVLDEVDAPLDEANIDRFLTVLRTFLNTTQFIIVTHNRKTIAMGDTLYGVTMQDPGISKIVSVKVQQDNDSSLPQSVKSQKDNVVLEDEIHA